MNLKYFEKCEMRAVQTKGLSQKQNWLLNEKASFCENLNTSPEKKTIWQCSEEVTQDGI